jgi:hypothetical protein
MSNQPPYPPNQPEHLPNGPRYQPQHPPNQPPPYGAYPPYPPPKSGPKKPSWFSRQSAQTKALLAGAAVLVVVLIVVIAASNSGGSANNSGGSGGTHVSGSRDDWLQAVCKDGTYRIPTSDMPVFNGATGAGVCLARSGGTIFVGQWDSDYMMRNAFTMSRLRCYAAAREGDTVTAFAPAPNASERALEPLTQFGFTIHELAPRNR